MTSAALGPDPGAGRRPAGAARPPRRLGPVHWLGLLTILRRELRAFFKEWPETIVAPTVTTLLFLAVFALALTGGPGGEARIAYMLPGLVLFAMLTRAAETTCFGIAFRKIEGQIGDIVMPPTRAWEVVAGYVAAGMISGIVTGVPCLLLILLVFRPEIADPGLAALFAALTVATLAAAGTIVGLWTEKWDQASAFFGFLLLPVTLVSGLFMPVEMLPEPLYGIARWNPIFYAMDGFRGAVSGIATVPAWHGIMINGGLVLLLMAIAIRALSSGWRLKP